MRAILRTSGVAFQDARTGAARFNVTSGGGVRPCTWPRKVDVRQQLTGVPSPLRLQKAGVDLQSAYLVVNKFLGGTSEFLGGARRPACT